MDGNHPKRRKDKYNPYTICEKNGKYYLSFSDGQGVRYEMEIVCLYRVKRQDGSTETENVCIFPTLILFCP